MTRGPVQRRERLPRASARPRLAREAAVETTLLERVNTLVREPEPVVEWGNPLLSTTPISLSVQQLAARTEALEHAVREIARDVQKLLAER